MSKLTDLQSSRMKELEPLSVSTHALLSSRNFPYTYPTIPLYRVCTPVYLLDELSTSFASVSIVG